MQILVGCIGISHIRYSKPTVADSNETITIKFEKYVGELFITADIGIHLYPMNQRGTHFPIFPIPLPIPSKDPPFTEPPFIVQIALKPFKSGVIFDPQEVYLWQLPSMKHTPSRIIGPFDCSSRAPRPNKRVLPVAAFVLDESVASCEWLEFDVPPFDPSQVFFIEIVGVKVDGKKQLLPTIQFKEDKRIELFSLP